MADLASDDLRRQNSELLKRMHAGLSKLSQLVNTTCEKNGRDGGNVGSESQKASKTPEFSHGQHRIQDDTSLFNYSVSTENGQKSAQRVTSTPRIYIEALESGGNNRSILKRSIKESSRRSILRTPKSGKKISSPMITHPSLQGPKGAKRDRHVTFTPKRTIVGNENNSQKFATDRSYLGYDWIAGMLDNKSTKLDCSDDYLEEIKEFRRRNKKDCFFSNEPFSGLQDNMQAFPTESVTASFVSADQGKENDYSCAGRLFMVNDRLQPIPIHGPDSYCPVCRSKKESESEYEESFIRVSVPRCTLQSPYKIKPHRRKSYDPSDSVALSEHCLAGWQSSWPATAPSLATLDLKSAVGSKYEDLVKTECKPRLKTKALMDSSYAIDYDMRRQVLTRATIEQDQLK